MAPSSSMNVQPTELQRVFDVIISEECFLHRVESMVFWGQKEALPSMIKVYEVATECPVSHPLYF